MAGCQIDRLLYIEKEIAVRYADSSKLIRRWLVDGQIALDRERYGWQIDR